MKAVLFVDGQCVLLKNEREEWELPGGKLEAGDSPEQTVLREIGEELGIEARVVRLLDSWNFVKGVDVLIITYLCETGACIRDLKISNEHKEVSLVSHDRVNLLRMPQGYKQSIRNAIL
ncbi:MAG TPA: NUDIX hydrolase [Aestuariivirgaceae bacterium]|nr:NUDIX hydrolase [Aestuariivirgaceae bacterium]